jgi:hypothetical protein
VLDFPSSPPAITAVVTEAELLETEMTISIGAIKDSIEYFVRVRHIIYTIVSVQEYSETAVTADVFSFRSDNSRAERPVPDYVLPPMGATSMFSISWRKGIVAIAVAISNRAIRTVNHDFRALVDSNLPSRVDRLPLRSVNARKSIVALTANSPFTVHWYYMLVLSHDWILHSLSLSHIKPR